MAQSLPILTPFSAPLNNTAIDVLNTLSNAILVLNIEASSEWPIIFVNSEAEKFTNQSRTTLLKSTFQSLFRDCKNLKTYVEKVISNSIATYETDFKLEGPKFKNKQVNLQIFPFGTQNKSILIVFSSNMLSSQLDQSINNKTPSKSVAVMSTVLAHEVKTPLSGIRGAAQLLEQNSTTEDKVLTNLICNECDRITNLIDEMEVFSNPKIINFQPQNIHEILSHVITLTNAGVGSDVNINFKPDPSLPSIPGNKDQLIQIFLNIIKNSIEAFQGPNGEIEITTAYRHGIRIHLADENKIIETPIEILIKDNGPGIDENLISHIFDPFVTLKTGGTGLGLALVQKFVGDHGGFVECRNEPTGATFKVLFPVWREKHE